MTEQEWQARERSLIETNNRELERRREAERRLLELERQHRIYREGCSSLLERRAHNAMLADFQIHARCMEGMITPYEAAQVSEEDGHRVISYGISSYGYDARLANEFKIFTNVRGALVDPKNFNPGCFIEHTGDYCDIPPNSFILGRTVEEFNIPRDILAVCLGKSTYARCGVVANVTPLEPEWRGVVTLELSNTTPCPARVYANEGVIQVIFLRASEFCSTSYLDRKGKYQDQKDLTLARL